MVWTSSCPSFWHGEMDGSSRRAHSSSWQDFNMRRKSGINQIFCPQWAMITPNRKLLYTCDYLEATNITASAWSPHCVCGDTTCRDCQRCAISGSWHSQLCLVPPMKQGGRVKRWVSLLRFLIHSWCRLSMLYLLSKSSFSRRFMCHVCFDSSTG